MAMDSANMPVDVGDTVLLRGKEHIIVDVRGDGVIVIPAMYLRKEVQDANPAWKAQAFVVHADHVRVMSKRNQKQIVQ